jgi:hypothetical protein
MFSKESIPDDLKAYALCLLIHFGLSQNLKFFREPRNRFQGIDPRAGIFNNSMEARNRGGIGLSYRLARLDRLAEFIPWN